MVDFLIAFLPNIATVLLIVCYLPQIVHLKKHKYNSAKEMNVPFWVILISALTLFLIYNILLFVKFGVYMGIITEAANVALAVVVLIQTLYYRSKKHRDSESPNKDVPNT